MNSQNFLFLLTISTFLVPIFVGKNANNKNSTQSAAICNSKLSEENCDQWQQAFDGNERRRFKRSGRRPNRERLTTTGGRSLRDRMASLRRGLVRRNPNLNNRYNPLEFDRQLLGQNAVARGQRQFGGQPNRNAAVGIPAPDIPNAPPISASLRVQMGNPWRTRHPYTFSEELGMVALEQRYNYYSAMADAEEGIGLVNEEQRDWNTGRLRQPVPGPVGELILRNANFRQQMAQHQNRFVPAPPTRQQMLRRRQAPAQRPLLPMRPLLDDRPLMQRVREEARSRRTSPYEDLYRKLQRAVKGVKSRAESIFEEDEDGGPGPSGFSTRRKRRSINDGLATKNLELNKQNKRKFG